jgi:hypothetical protein
MSGIKETKLTPNATGHHLEDAARSPTGET